jgi:uncharacterized phiE125 gp8 family phage protein
MASILTAPPAAEPVSLDEAKAHLRLTAGEEDTLISTLITVARRVVEARTGLSLMAQGWTCFLDQWPEDGVIELPIAPVAEVEELAVFSEEDAKAEIDPSHYAVDFAARPVRLMLRGSRQWQRPGRALNGIAVRLRAGFGEERARVPAPLRQAVLILVAHWYAHRGDGEPPPLPPSADALMRPYRAVRL